MDTHRICDRKVCVFESMQSRQKAWNSLLTLKMAWTPLFNLMCGSSSLFLPHCPPTSARALPPLHWPSVEDDVCEGGSGSQEELIVQLNAAEYVSISADLTHLHALHQCLMGKTWHLQSVNSWISFNNSPQVWINHNFHWPFDFTMFLGRESLKCVDRYWDSYCAKC